MDTQKWSKIIVSKIVPGPFGLLKQVVEGVLSRLRPIFAHARAPKPLK